MVDQVGSYDPQRHHRRSVRLKGYDYAQAGGYFVTICVRERLCDLGEVIDGEMRLSPAGKVAFDFWEQIPIHFTNVKADIFVVVPNHVHAVLIINNGRGDVTSPINQSGGETPKSTGGGPPKSSGGETPPLRGATLGQIVAYYKYQTTVLINNMRGTAGTPFWQRGYYEHIVRNEGELLNIRKYILENPLRWALDRENPAPSHS